MSVPTVILSAARTPWGRLLGSLSDISGPELGAAAVAAALREAGIAATDVEYAAFGNVLSDGTQGHPAGALCRAADLAPGLPALTLRMGCASGLAAVAQATEAVAAGRAQVALAGGFESSSRAPHLADGLRRGLRLGSATLRDSARHDGPVAHDPPLEDLSRRREAARETGRLADGLHGVDLPRPRKGQPPRVEEDDPPGEGAPLPLLADGAAALVVAARPWAEGRRLRPLCAITAAERPFEMAGDQPEVQADLPREAWERLLEALDGDASRVNPDGGTGLGHAAGADGARLACSLARALARGGIASGLALAGDPYGGISAVALRALTS